MNVKTKHMCILEYNILYVIYVWLLWYETINKLKDIRVNSGSFLSSTKCAHQIVHHMQNISMIQQCVLKWWINGSINNLAIRIIMLLRLNQCCLITALVALIFYSWINQVFIVRSFTVVQFCYWLRVYLSSKCTKTTKQAEERSFPNIWLQHSTCFLTKAFSWLKVLISLAVLHTVQCSSVSLPWPLVENKRYCNWPCFFPSY